MKKLLITLMALTSISSFANTDSYKQYITPFPTDFDSLKEELFKSMPNNEWKMGTITTADGASVECAAVVIATDRKLKVVIGTIVDSKFETAGILDVTSRTPVASQGYGYDMSEILRDTFTTYFQTETYGFATRVDSSKNSISIQGPLVKFSNGNSKASCQF